MTSEEDKPPRVQSELKNTRHKYRAFTLRHLLIWSQITTVMIEKKQ